MNINRFFVGQCKLSCVALHFNHLKKVGNTKTFAKAFALLSKNQKREKNEHDTAFSCRRIPVHHTQSMCSILHLPMLLKMRMRLIKRLIVLSDSHIGTSSKYYPDKIEKLLHDAAFYHYHLRNKNNFSVEAVSSNENST